MTDAKRLLIMSLLVLLLPVVGWGQQTSSVTGLVTDSTGAVLRGADVKLTDIKTAREQSTKTDEQGVYTFIKVPPGTGYTLVFSAQGFETLEIKNVVLGVGVTETHNAQMTIGQVSNTVTVTSAEGATLNTTDASIGNVISTRRIQELPIQLRNSPAALIGLQAGVVGNNLGSGPTTGTRTGSVTGARADQGNITIDGIDANDQATGQAFFTVGNAPVDSIQEFRTVSLNPGTAEGRSSGGQIMMVTKGGTNEFHGSLREYNRTALTAANNFFNNKAGIERAQLTRNQFGGSIGGPVYLPRFGQGGRRFINGKDRLFFFFDYEGRRDAQGQPYLRIVPLDHFRNGSLRYINDAGGISELSPAQIAGLDPRNIANPGTGGPNQAFLDFLNGRYPQANDLSAGDGINTGGFRFNSPSHRSDNTYTTRIDFNATDKQKVFTRFNIVRSLQTDTTNTVAQQFPGDPESGQIINSDYAVVGGHNWIINSSLVNQATVGVTTSVLKFASPFAPTSPNIFGNPAILNGGTFGGNNFGISAPFARISTQARNVPVPTIRDDLSWNKGSHSLAFGASIKPLHQESNQTNDFNFVGIGLGGGLPNLNAMLRPSNLATDEVSTGSYDAAFAFILGRYASIGTNFNYDASGNAFAPGTGKARDYRYNEYEFYAQDSWKVRNNLTLTFGLRYHYYPPPYEANGVQAGSDVDFQQLYDIRVRNAAAGISGPAAEPLLNYSLIGKGNNARGYYETDRNNFSPRLAFAYTPTPRGGFLQRLFGDRKTVIRGGGAVIYDRVSNGITFLQDQSSYIFDNSVTFQYGASDPSIALRDDDRFTDINTLPRQNTPPVITNPLAPFVDENGVPIGNATGEQNYTVSQRFKIPYSIQYSFGFQRELPGNYLLEVSYVGRQARKLFTQADAAQILDFKDPASGQFMLSAFNGLQSELQAAARAGEDPSEATVTPQPWFENQIGPGGTALVSNNFAGLVLIGDTSDTIQLLYRNRFLAPNVGLSGQFSTNAYVTNLGSSSYNAMLVTLRKRLSYGLEFDLNYTYSHSIDNQSSLVNTVFGGVICDVNNLRACRGDSDFDVRHIINANWLYELPFGRGKSFGGNAKGWLNALIGGWQFGGIFTYRPGLAFSTTTDSFPLSFVLNYPAVLTSGNTGALQQGIHDADDGTIQFFSDPDIAGQTALRFPRHGETGNRNILRGPSYWNVDSSLLKSFRLPGSETTKLQFRWEAYNLFNHNNFGLPNANLSSPLFGQITTSATTEPARVMQFALRLQF